MNVRTVKDYSKLNRQMEILFKLDVKITRLLESFDFEKQKNNTLNYSI